MSVPLKECYNKANTRITSMFSWSVEELRSSSTFTESYYDNVDCYQYRITITHIPTNEVYGSCTSSYNNNYKNSETN